MYGKRILQILKKLKHKTSGKLLHNYFLNLIFITAGRKSGIMERVSEESTKVTSIAGSLNSNIHDENTIFKSSSG